MFNQCYLPGKFFKNSLIIYLQIKENKFNLRKKYFNLFKMSDFLDFLYSNFSTYDKLYFRETIYSEYQNPELLFYELVFQAYKYLIIILNLMILNGI